MTSYVTCLGAEDANSGVTGSKWIFLYCQVLFIALCQADFETQNQRNSPKNLRGKSRVTGRGCWVQLSSVAGGNVQWDPCCAKSFSILLPKHTQALCTVPSTANSSHSKLHLGKLLECLRRKAHDGEVRLYSTVPCDGEMS